MRLSKTLAGMDMADYSAALDPAYTTLEFENVQVLTMGNGRWGQLGRGMERIFGAGLWDGRGNAENCRLVLYRCCQVKQVGLRTVARGILGD